MAKKGQTLIAWLPAGDLYLVAVPGSAEGTVVVDRFWYHEKPIDGLTLTIKGGKVVEMQAKSGPWSSSSATTRARVARRTPSGW